MAVTTLYRSVSRTVPANLVTLCSHQEGERVDEQDLRPSILPSADRLRLFTEAILGGPPINVCGEGQMRRDFAYIDNIVAGVIACLDNSSADDCVAKAGGSISLHPI